MYIYYIYIYKVFMYIYSQPMLQCPWRSEGALNPMKLVACWGLEEQEVLNP